MLLFPLFQFHHLLLPVHDLHGPQLNLGIPPGGGRRLVAEPILNHVQGDTFQPGPAAHGVLRPLVEGNVNPGRGRRPAPPLLHPLDREGAAMDGKNKAIQGSG